MSKIKSERRLQSGIARAFSAARLRVGLALLVTLIVGAGCGNQNVNMRNQPRYDPYQQSEFWSNGTSARELPKNTVARGFLKTNTAFWEGREAPAPSAASGQSGQGAQGTAQAAPAAQGTASAVGGSQGTAAQQAGPSAQGTAPTSAGAQSTPAPPRATSVGTGGVVGQGTPGANAAGTSSGAGAAQGTPQAGGAQGGTAQGGAAQGAAQGGPPQYINTFPFPVTDEVMRRGQERYNIFCTPCHGYLGEGNGLTTRVGMKVPPSFHIDRLRTAPAGYFYDVITNGFGVMPNYGDQIYVNDRWAIVAYIRALQLSQNVKADELTPEQRNQLNAGGQ